MEKIKYKEITVLKANGNPNSLFGFILNSINIYLIRNFGTVNDFNLIKDVVERANQTKDEEIGAMLPLSIYLGLGGTMLGIIVGLFFMPDVSSNEFDGAINTLVGGVSLAMITSAVGLGVMIWLTLRYKGAKSQNEEGKNSFYTYVQTELMPVLTDNAAGSSVTMQRNLNKFNQEFKENIGRFEPVLQSVLQVARDQKDMLQALKDQDITNMAKLNIQLVKTVQASAADFKSFNTYIQTLNKYIASVKSDMESLVTDRMQVTNAVAQVDAAMKDAVRQLKIATDERIVDMNAIVANSSAPLLDFNKQQVAQINEYAQKISSALMESVDILRKQASAKIEEFNDAISSDRLSLDSLFAKQDQQGASIAQLANNMDRYFKMESERSILLQKVIDQAVLKNNEKTEVVLKPSKGLFAEKWFSYLLIVAIALIMLASIGTMVRWFMPSNASQKEIPMQKVVGQKVVLEPAIAQSSNVDSVSITSQKIEQNAQKE